MYIYIYAYRLTSAGGNESRSGRKELQRACKLVVLAIVITPSMPMKHVAENSDDTQGCPTILGSSSARGMRRAASLGCLSGARTAAASHRPAAGKPARRLARSRGLRGDPLAAAQRLSRRRRRRRAMRDGLPTAVFSRARASGCPWEKTPTPGVTAPQCLVVSA